MLESVLPELVDLGDGLDPRDAPHDEKMTKMNDPLLVSRSLSP